MPDTAGLRISAVGPDPSEDWSAPGMQVELVPSTGQKAQVLEVGGAQIFLYEQAASHLDDKVLDAEVDRETVHLTTSPHGPK